MLSLWPRRSFLRLLKFLRIKEGRPNFWGEPILQNSWIIWSPILYFNFTTFKDPVSLSFIRFQCILYDSGDVFSDFWNFNKLKSGDLISGRGPILQKVWIVCLPLPRLLLYFNYKIFKDPNSLSFIRFQYTLHDAGVIFSESSNFYNLMAGRWDLITGGRKFGRKSELFGPPFCISILNTQNLGHSINFSVFCTIQHCFSQSLEIYIN